MATKKSFCENARWGTAPPAPLDAPPLALRSAKALPENFVELLLEATKEDKNDFDGSNDGALGDEFFCESFDDEN